MRRLLAAGRRTCTALLRIASVALVAGGTTFASHWAGTGQAASAAPGACEGEVVDANWVRVTCAPGYATARDTIRIFRRRGTDPRQSWQQNLDYEDAIWLFERGDRGVVALAIDFHRDGTRLVADLFDDGDGDGRVAVHLARGVPSVGESMGRWKVRVAAPDGWWVREGRTNFNLDIAIDGQVRATLLHDLYLYTLRTDGEVDITVHVRDSRREGKPSHEWRLVDARDFAPEDAYYRTSIIANTEYDELPIQGSLFWPYLNAVPLAADAVFLVKDYNESPAPIRVDWQKAQLGQIGEFVGSRSNPGSFFIYSFVPLQLGTLNRTNHENPFAFYDLAEANDGYPDLAVRLETYRANDPFIEYGREPQPRLEVEYTWDQEHTHNWSYMLGLLGRHEIDRTIEFPEFAVTAVPHAELPAWVMGRPWDVATFVAVETLPYWTSEHIYEWTVRHGSERLWHEYLPGRDDLPPVDDYREISAGLRGEYKFHLDARPELYFSPVDRKLHLTQAQGGVWNVDDVRKVRYANLGGPYLNHWSFEVDGKTVENLYFVEDQVVLTDGQRVQIKRVSVPSALFTTMPPTTPDEWHSLRDRLAGHRPGAGALGLAPLFAALEGSVEVLEGTSLSEVRLAPGGFRGSLHVGERAAPHAGLPRWADRLGSGHHVLRYQRDGGYAVEPAVAAGVAVSSLSIRRDSDAARTPMALTVTLQNVGNVDAAAARVRVVAGREGAPPQTIATTVVPVVAEGRAEIKTQWVPDSPGRWIVEAEVLDGGRPAERTVVDVARAPSPDTRALLAAQALGPWPRVGLAAILAAAVVAAGHVGLQRWARPAERREAVVSPRDRGRPW